MAIVNHVIATAQDGACQVSVNVDDTATPNPVQSIRCQNNTAQPMVVTATRIEGGSASHTFAANFDETFDVRLFNIVYTTPAPGPTPTKGILISIRWPATAVAH